jgi:hypothetical protein
LEKPCKCGAFLLIADGVRLLVGAEVMGTKEPSLGDMTAFAREQFGLDPDLDRSAIAQLAAIGLTVQAWRNTCQGRLKSHPLSPVE